MHFLQAVRIAWETIRVQNLKSFFTVLGVTIGVTFLIAVVSIVGGMSRYMEDDLVGKLIAVNSFSLRSRPDFQMGDATQALCVFVLRSYRVTVAPLVAYCVLLWGVGVLGGYQLAYRGIGVWDALQRPSAFWMASTTALAILAVVLPLILWRAVRGSRIVVS